MIQLNFLNARVRDTGYGLEVNGKPLDEIISVAVGTLKELPDKFGSKQRTGEIFGSDLCNVSVTIDDRSKEITETITISEVGEEEYPLEEFLEGVKNEYNKKTE